MSRFTKIFKIAVRSRMGLAIAVALSASFATFASAHAAEPGQSSWRLGAGVAAIKKPYRDMDTKTMGLPIVGYENKWISAAIPTLDLKLYSDDSLSFRLRARYAGGDGYEADDSPFLAGMEDRKASLWAGAAVTWKTDFANFTGEVLADTMGKSKGIRARLQVDRRFAVGKFGFIPRLAAEWTDDKYVDYYYGVRQSEVTATRAFYQGKSTTHILAGLRVDYMPTKHHTVYLDLAASRYGSTVKDSPLVDKPNQTSIGLGYMYRY
ncbi:MipA/OmpV family protein [Pollutimonas sp. M17]|uniref:MipA/OmpV family protein n=1 Tax=Pollutimonas sp. M17 TaxID=2962065 RepID=UPI0021F4B685|nr:MipA/OmpV family protein [Pollutimonas sp. M17]UYO93156.1 MipA/OmpV family protein [Pollutimonas sp. M17]